MNSKLTFRMLERQDNENVIALLNSVFRVPITIEEWEWFVFGNPDGPSRIYLAIHEKNQIVGTAGFSPTKLKINNKLFNVSYGHHLAISPKFRNTISYLKLMQYSLNSETTRGVNFVIGPPNPNSYGPHKVLMGWQDFGYLDLLYKLNPKTCSHSCFEIDSFGEEFDIFYSKLSKKYSFNFVQTSDRMNWRYFGRPRSPYTTYVYYEGDKLLGYIILKRWVEPDGYRETHIMDIQVLKDYFIEELLKAAESYATDCDQFDLWCVKGYPYRNKLEETGFIYKKTDRRPIAIRTLDGSKLIFPNEPASFMYGDSDQY